MVKLETICLTIKTVHNRTEHLSAVEDNNLECIYASYQEEEQQQMPYKVFY